MPEEAKNGEQSSDYFVSRTRLTVHDEEGQKAYPTLLWLLLPEYRDGKLVRAEGKLTLFPDGASFLVRIECPSLKLQAVCSVDSLKNLLRDVERYLASPNCEWKQTFQAKKKLRDAIAKPEKGKT